MNENNQPADENDQSTDDEKTLINDGQDKFNSTNKLMIPINGSKSTMIKSNNSVSSNMEHPNEAPPNIYALRTSDSIRNTRTRPHFQQVMGNNISRLPINNARNKLSLIHNQRFQMVRLVKQNKKRKMSK